MIEVYVVLEMANGYIEDISVHRKEPIGLTPIDEFGDNGHYLFHLPIEEDAWNIKYLQNGQDIQR